MLLVFFFFFFKQKTAYEMRISDWSSDVCSSDLLDAFGDQYMVRGFGVSQTVNGVATAVLNHARDTANVERIEVLKGPASVLYGQMQPGAVINIVTKQPTTDFQAGFGASGGRYDNFRGEADISGPLNADGTIAARITGAYENSDSFVDFWHKTHGFVAPVIAFRPGQIGSAPVRTPVTNSQLDCRT